ncbi:hypothetical protein CEXT_126521 [Caerostris extrusa]|uniref:Uncharacterized protein n=1 Tax=Caerostris extrusa TaxID=172846 RepID=A0AAV4P059_CAEEX|nr:hypothetical protein CEXT_126521 [Caerostris extrusa]
MLCENDTVALKVETHSKNMQPSVEMDSLLLIQKQPNSVILSSANSIETENTNGCHPRRNRPTISFKEPSLKGKSFSKDEKINIQRFKYPVKQKEYHIYMLNILTFVNIHNDLL